MSLKERGLASLDMTVSTPRNIKGFTVHPPDGLKLYVKYRGDISPGQGNGQQEAPLGAESKNIEGTILDALIYPTGMRFLIAFKVTKSTSPEDVGKTITIYPTRDLISLYPFRSLGYLVKKKMMKNKIRKLKGYAEIHDQLAFLPDEDGMTGRATIKAKARFEGKDPEFPLQGPFAEYDHDDYQGQRYDDAVNKSGQIQDSTGNKHIGDDKLGGRRHRRKTRRKTKRKSRKLKKRRRKKRKTRKKKSRKKKTRR